MLFQSTPPARGATIVTAIADPVRHISIHAPREGGRLHNPTDTRHVCVISIHAPREGGDCWRSCASCGYPRFQSTPPARGATFAHLLTHSGKWYFNPRPPRGGRPIDKSTGAEYINISIHAPREGGDMDFAGTLLDMVISIHAPREGGDSAMTLWKETGNDFNPRPPRGGRRHTAG